MAEPLIGQTNGQTPAADPEAAKPPYITIVKTGDGLTIQSNIKPEFEELVIGILAKAQMMVASGAFRQKPKVQAVGGFPSGLLKRMRG